MLKVTFQPEPANFQTKVSAPGQKWLDTHPNTASAKIRPYWRKCLPDLHRLYHGICAYYGWYIEAGKAGSWSVDHFIPKSVNRNLAYQWSNFRFCHKSVNTSKGEKLNILDPFDVLDNLFVLNLLSGEIFVNTDTSFNSIRPQAQNTIIELQLNDASLKNKRAKDFSNYLKNKVTSDYLKEYNPFVWYEAHRQGYL